MTNKSKASKNTEAHNQRTNRPPGKYFRTIFAYWILFRILLSYTWFRIQARFYSKSGAATLLKRKHRRNAKRIRHGITKLQGLFIKVGQLISILTNFLPEEFRQELEGLQDQVPPHPYVDIEKRLRDEFGGSGPEETFRDFDTTALAAASIGQVHIGTTLEGEKVAVKVQYPEIESLMRADIRILRRIFNVLERWMPDQGLSDVYMEIRSMVVAELDFEKEAQSITTIAQNFHGRPGFAFPKVFSELSTKRVLTTTFEEGIKAANIIEIDKANIPRQELAEKIIYGYCEQIFKDGFYHADPHPGNILTRLSEDGSPQVVFLDFGATARVSDTMRRGMAEIVQGGIASDTQRVLRALRSMGFIAKTADPDVYEKIVEFFHQRFHDEIRVESLSLKDIRFDPSKGFENLADLRQMDISFSEFTKQFHVPKEWILLERTFLLLMGLCTELAPELNPLDIIQPYVERFLLGDRDPAAFVMNAAKELLFSAISLPGEIRRAMGSLQKGNMEVRFSNLDDNVDTLYHLGHQLIYTLFGIFSGGLGLALWDRGHQNTSIASGILSGFFILLLGGSMWRERRRRRRLRRRNRKKNHF